MKIVEISVQNYKSLKNLTFSPEDLTFIVGANGSGKSNFSDCIDFIAEVYRLGLEIAVSRKGGYENIAFRRMRRSKSPIRISTCIIIDPRTDTQSPHLRRQAYDQPLRLRHTFSFVAKGSSIRAEFGVVEEQFQAEVIADETWNEVFAINRNGSEITTRENPDLAIGRSQSKRARAQGQQSLFDTTDLEILKARYFTVASSELSIVTLGRFVPAIRSFTRALETLRVYQISPSKSREFGVPIPRPELDRLGGNLPAVIDVLSKRSHERWETVMQLMRTILPNLQKIEVDYTSSRTLGLQFHETGYARPWSVGEVSDGTIQTLALLVAILGSDARLMVIEEPENSVHPWIIRQIIEACRAASDNKQIVITTHSPVAINLAKPQEIRVLWRAQGETQMSVLADLDESFLPLWERGEISAFDYLDSGTVVEAVPPDADESGDEQ